MVNKLLNDAKRESAAGVISAVFGVLISIIVVWMVIEVCLLGLAKAQITRVASDLARQASSYRLAGSQPFNPDGFAAVELGKLYRASKISIAQNQSSTVVVVAIPAAVVMGGLSADAFDLRTIQASSTWPTEGE